MSEIIINIDPDFIRLRIKEIFNNKKWKYDLGNGLDIYKEAELIDDLVNRICEN